MSEQLHLRGAVTMWRAGPIVRWTAWREMNIGRGVYKPNLRGWAFTRAGATRRAHREAAKYGWKAEWLPVVAEVKTLTVFAGLT